MTPDYNILLSVDVFMTFKIKIKLSAARVSLERELYFRAKVNFILEKCSCC